MSRKAFVKIQHPGERIRENETEGISNAIDWGLCILCQEDTGEKLQCPRTLQRPDFGAGYERIAQNIEGFLALIVCRLTYKRPA